MDGKKLPLSKRPLKTHLEFAKRKKKKRPKLLLDKILSYKSKPEGAAHHLSNKISTVITSVVVAQDHRVGRERLVTAEWSKPLKT